MKTIGGSVEKVFAVINTTNYNDDGKYAVVKVLAQCLVLFGHLLLKEELTVTQEMHRHPCYVLREERAQHSFLLECRLTVEVAFYQLLYVFVV